MKHLLASVSLLLAACGGSGATKPVAPHADTAAPPSPAVAAPDTAQPAASGAPLDLLLAVERSGDGVGLSVINRGNQTAQLAADVDLELVRGNGFEKVPGQALKLRFDCKSQGCVSLAPGAELMAPAWLGRADGERCDGLAQLPGVGHYRVVVHACQGNGRSELTFVQSTPP